MIESSYSDIKSEARHWLEDLRPDEVETLKGLIRLGQTVGMDRLRDGAKLADQVETVGKFSRWTIITVVGIFVASISFAEQIGKLVTFIRGGIK